MVQSSLDVVLSPVALLVGSLVVAAGYFLLALVVTAASSGRRRAVAERLQRTAALPAVVGVGAFAFTVTLPPLASGLVFLLGLLAVVLAVVAAPALAVTLALDPDALD
jgi:hypothetical protein